MKKLKLLVLMLMLGLTLSGCEDGKSYEKTELKNGCVLVDSMYSERDRVDCGAIEYTLVEYIMLLEQEAEATE